MGHPVVHFEIRSPDPLQLGEVAGQILITALVSYRDPALAVRCGLPEIIG